MSNKELLCNIGIVPNKQAAIDSILYCTDYRTVDIERVNRAAEAGAMYLDEAGRVLDGDFYNPDSLACYKLVSLGYLMTGGSWELCASFNSNRGQWSGIYTGSAYSLIRKTQERYYIQHPEEKAKLIIPQLFRDKNFRLVGFGYPSVEKNNSGICKKMPSVTDTPVKEVENVYTPTNINWPASTICSDIFSILMVRNIWGIHWNTRLRSHLKIILEKIQKEQSTFPEVQFGNGYILNKNKQLSLINTGLLDRFGNYICIVDKTNGVSNIDSKQLSLSNGKSWLVSIGFDKEDIIKSPAPIKFYDNASDLIFDGMIEDFDLENRNTLAHIIQERKSRMPEDCMELQDEVICSKIYESIRTSIKISQMDYRYIIPIYFPKEDRMCYLMPLFITNPNSGNPDVAMVVRKENGFYIVVTILDLETACANARLVCNPNGSWLAME